MGHRSPAQKPGMPLTPPGHLTFHLDYRALTFASGLALRPPSPKGSHLTEEPHTLPYLAPILVVLGDEGEAASFSAETKHADPVQPSAQTTQ